MKKNKEKKNKNKKGFTLIELLSVIVILGILMLIAIPAVTRYIESSKKEAFIKEINSLVDTVRYGINSGESTYQNKINFDFSEIELEKGKKTKLKGSVTFNKASNKYVVKAIDEKNNYCLSGDASKIDKSMLKDCDSVYEYEIGNKVTFAGRDWYVIENATIKQEYVTVIKETVLTKTELTEDYTYDSTDAMAYYWEPGFCYAHANYGTWQSRGWYTGRCINTYGDSKIRKFFDEVYINTLGSDNLVSVNDYKIRLITIEELQNVFKYQYDSNEDKYIRTSDTKEFIYKNFGENGDDIYSYWTMSPYPDASNIVWEVRPDGLVDSNGVNNGTGVRPVINLLKTAIE